MEAPQISSINSSIQWLKATASKLRVNSDPQTNQTKRLEQPEKLTPRWRGVRRNVPYFLKLCPVSHQSGQQLSWFTWPETQDLRYFSMQLYWHTKEFAVKEALFSIIVLIINTFCLKRVVFVWRYLWCTWECVGKFIRIPFSCSVSLFTWFFA